MIDLTRNNTPNINILGRISGAEAVLHVEREYSELFKDILIFILIPGHVEKSLKPLHTSNVRKKDN